MLNRKESAMHDLFIASSFIAMLVLPCIAAMGKKDSAEDAN